MVCTCDLVRHVAVPRPSVDEAVPAAWQNLEVAARVRRCVDVALASTLQCRAVHSFLLYPVWPLVVAIIHGGCISVNDVWRLAV